MVLTSVLAPVIGYLVCVISTLPVEAYHKHLVSDQKHPDKFPTHLGITSLDAVKQSAQTYEDEAPLKHVDENSRLWPSAEEIVRSMEEDRMTKTVVSDVVMGRYRRSPQTPTLPSNQNMRDRSGQSGNTMMRKKQRSGRAAAAQIPQGMPDVPMPTPTGMPDMPKPPTSMPSML